MSYPILGQIWEVTCEAVEVHRVSYVADHGKLILGDKFIIVNFVEAYSSFIDISFWGQDYWIHMLHLADGRYRLIS